jgi:hypothetical protein
MSQQTTIELADRLRRIRVEVFGPDGLDELARLSGIPARTWANHESGITMSAVIMLKFIELTTVEPRWLLNGQGPKLRDPATLRGNEQSLAPEYHLQCNGDSVH